MNALPQWWFDYSIPVSALLLAILGFGLELFGIHGCFFCWLQVSRIVRSKQHSCSLQYSSDFASNFVTGEVWLFLRPDDEQPVRFARLAPAPFTDRLVAKFDLPVDGWRGRLRP